MRNFNKHPVHTLSYTLNCFLAKELLDECVSTFIILIHNIKLPSKKLYALTLKSTEIKRNYFSYFYQHRVLSFFFILVNPYAKNIILLVDY